MRLLTALLLTAGCSLSVDQQTEFPSAGACGDGVVRGDEECDRGPRNGRGSGCDDDCQLAIGQSCDGPDGLQECASPLFVQRCEQGQWRIVDECEEDTQRCRLGTCATLKECDAAEDDRCAGQARESCIRGHWILQELCTDFGQRCDAGECVVGQVTPPPKGEGEGEGEPPPGEGEGEPPPGEGEGEPPPVGEGEGEGEPPPGEGEGEGEPPVGEGEGEGEGEPPVVNQAPEIQAVIAPANALVGQIIDLEVQATDPEGGDLFYRWHVPAGVPGTPFAARTGWQARPVGVQTVTVTVTDDQGAEVQGQAEIDVAAREGCRDADQDGHGRDDDENGLPDGDECLVGVDCDDDDPDRYPGNPERCDDVDHDCDEDEDPVNVDRPLLPDHCGACFAACDIPGALADCQDDDPAPVCVFAGCQPDWHDRNGDPEDGCEVLCRLTNGGVEVVDGVDNDCDGVVDDVDEPPDEDAFCAARASFSTDLLCEDFPADLLARPDSDWRPGAPQRVGERAPGRIIDGQYASPPADADGSLGHHRYMDGALAGPFRLSFGVRFGRAAVSVGLFAGLPAGAEDLGRGYEFVVDRRADAGDPRIRVVRMAPATQVYSAFAPTLAEGTHRVEVERTADGGWQVRVDGEELADPAVNAEGEEERVVSLDHLGLHVAPADDAQASALDHLVVEIDPDGDGRYGVNDGCPWVFDPGQDGRCDAGGSWLVFATAPHLGSPAWGVDPVGGLMSPLAAPEDLEIRDVAVSPSGRTVAFADGDELRVLDRDLENPRCVAANRRFPAFVDDDYVVYTDADRLRAYACDVVDGVEVGSLEAPDNGWIGVFGSQGEAIVLLAGNAPTVQRHRVTANGFEPVEGFDAVPVPPVPDLASVALTPDRERYVLAGDEGQWLGVYLTGVRGEGGDGALHGRMTYSIHVLPGGRQAVAIESIGGDRNRVTSYDLAPGAPVSELVPPSSTMRGRGLSLARLHAPGAATDVDGDRVDDAVDPCLGERHSLPSIGVSLWNDPRGFDSGLPALDWGDGWWGLAGIYELNDIVFSRTRRGGGAQEVTRVREAGDRQQGVDVAFHQGAWHVLYIMGDTRETLRWRYVPGEGGAARPQVDGRSSQHIVAKAGGDSIWILRVNEERSDVQRLRDEFQEVFLPLQTHHDFDGLYGADLAYAGGDRATVGAVHHGDVGGPTMRMSVFTTDGAGAQHGRTRISDRFVYEPSIVAGPDVWAIAWRHGLDDGSGQQIRLQTYSDDIQAVPPAEAPIVIASGPSLLGPRVVRSPEDDGYLVSWSTGYAGRPPQVFVRFVDDGGGLGPVVRLTDAPALHGYDVAVSDHRLGLATASGSALSLRTIPSRCLKGQPAQ